MCCVPPSASVGTIHISMDLESQLYAHINNQEVYQRAELADLFIADSSSTLDSQQLTPTKGPRQRYLG